MGDDCSTDGTADIVAYYAAKHDRIIKPQFREKNLGPAQNALDILSLCKGKYIAMLEGDDFWSVEDKLQKQIDFLESNPEYSLCCHRFETYDVDNKKFVQDPLIGFFEINSEGITIDLELFFSRWLTKTLTVVFRNYVIDLEVFKRFKYFRDVHLFYHLLLTGRGFCLNFYGGLYNVHSQGVWGKRTNMERLQNSYSVLNELHLFHKNDRFLTASYQGTLKRFIQARLIDYKDSERKELFYLIVKYLKISRNWKLTLNFLINLVKN